MKLIGLVLMLLWPWQGKAAEPVVLTIFGNIQLDGRHYEQLDYTLSELQALPQADITTTHPWVQEPRHYRGPELVAILTGLFGHTRIKTLYLEALNGFSVAVDWQTVAPFHPILAWQEDGRVMGRRDKGPLWLMLPFDQVPELQQADFLHFMAWQLRHVRVHTELK
ncbi:molybdopterin-binding protein [Zobellella sp. DQSA1]|uniref:molybdopterin-binding protein n=1 Tax=Zobellella sp. DQSA1 TaxID=3342386 RepID=UPI0035BF9CD3